MIDYPVKAKINLNKANDIIIVVISQINNVVNVSHWIIDFVWNNNLIAYTQVNEGEEFSCLD